MAYYDTINLVSGDDKPELNFTLRDSNTAATGATLDPDDATTWAPIDLSSQVVKLHFRPLGGTLENTTVNTMTCTVTAPATNGECIMQWNATTLDVDAGTYEAEIELTDSVSGRVQTIFDKLKFKVRDDF
jgi:hypothetical protein